MDNWIELLVCLNTSKNILIGIELNWWNGLLIYWNVDYTELIYWTGFIYLLNTDTPYTHSSDSYTQASHKVAFTKIWIHRELRWTNFEQSPTIPNFVLGKFVICILIYLTLVATLKKLNQIILQQKQKIGRTSSFSLIRK